MSGGYRKTSKQKLRRERIRLEKHQSRLERVRESRAMAPGEFEDDEPFPVPAHRFLTERFFWEVEEAKGDRVFESVEEANEFMSGIQGQKMPLPTTEASTNPKFRAQMLAFDALESSDGERAIALAREALNLDPNCVDALATLANDPENTKQRRLAGLRHAVEVAEAELGPDFRTEYEGRFWRDHKTRPYMRTRFDLAMALQESGTLQEALGELEAVLTLDPEDSLAVRDILMGTYILTANREGQKRLLDMFDDGFFGMFTWSRVFYDWTGGDLEKARESLARARAQNPHVEPYLTGARPLPEHLPDEYAPKQPSEAQQIAFFTGLAWRETSGLAAWLMRQKSTGSKTAGGTGGWSAGEDVD